MAYIDTQYLGKCYTCRNLRSGGCNTYCDHGEEYSPDLSKIPTADVVPRAELDAMRGAANSYKMHYENAKAEVAREIFGEIETSLCYKFINGEIHLIIREEDYKEYKKKYTE